MGIYLLAGGGGGCFPADAGLLRSLPEQNNERGWLVVWFAFSSKRLTKRTLFQVCLRVPPLRWVCTPLADTGV